MNPHAHIRSLDVPSPQATALWSVRPCAGRLGAADLSPSGAYAFFEAAHQAARS
jgi:hypothetical protein